MNNGKLTNWLLATLTAVLMAVASVGYANVTAASAQIAGLTERVAVLETQATDTERRLIRIENKLDILVQTSQR